MPDPSTFVLFGATGDLSHRKVVPALYQLWRSNLLPHEFCLVAVGRRPFDDASFAGALRESAAKYARVQPVDEETWATFAERIVYHRGDFDDETMSHALAERLDAIDAERGTSGNRLF